tara:strand:- start:157 stop:747 length:591 start_codon:yes stop_codon:yes gene_type:complete
MPKKNKPKKVEDPTRRVYCGATTRKGEPCKRLAIKSVGRCRLHGGKSRRAHGIYAQVLTDEELELYDNIPIGTVDAELKVSRIRLLRAMKAKELVDDAPDDPNNRAGMVVTGIKQSQKSGKRGKYAESEQYNEVERTRTDYDAIIERLLGRIGTLERTRAELLATTDLGSPDEFALEIQAAMAAMNAQTEADGTVE